MKATLQNLLTGDIIDVHSTTDSPDSSYGFECWVDKEGNSYGQCQFVSPVGYSLICKGDTESTPAKRFKQLRAHLRLTQKEFAKSLHVSMAYIAVIETKTVVRHPSYNLIITILTTYPEVDANWLMRGTGSMLKEGIDIYIDESYIDKK